MRVLGIGDNVCDKYLHMGMMYPGGQAMNVAVYCAIEGEKAGYIGVFGNDEVAEHIIKVLNEIGLDIERCRYLEGENGYAEVDVIDGERVFLGSNKGGVMNDHPIVLDDDDLKYISGYDIVHTSNNSYVIDELPKLKKIGAIVSYDFSHTWQDKDILKSVCPYIDFAFLSASGQKEDEILKTV